MSLIFYNYNLVNQENTAITPSADNVYFPASNLKDERRTKVFRVDQSSVNVVFDFTTIEDVDSILLVPHTKNGWGFTSVLVEANATSNFASPAFSTTITTEIDQEQEIAIKSFATQSYRFWRLTFIGTTFVEVSKVFIGKALDMGRGPSLNWSFIEQDKSQLIENKYGQVFIDKYPKQKSINVAYEYLDKDELDTLFEVLDYNSIHKPLFARFSCPDILNNVNRFAGYFYLAQSPEISNPSYALYSTSFTLRESM